MRRGWILVPTLLWAISGQAMAQTRDEAHELLRQAIQSFDNGAFPRSRELLLGARERTRDARLLGQVHLYLGLNAAVESGPQAARGQFRLALTHDPGLRLDARRFKPEIVSAFDAVRGELIGTLRVTTNREGVAVWIDGARAGPPPVARDVRAGKHVVELRDRRGARVLRREVEVHAGRSERLDVTVVPPPVERPPDEANRSRAAGPRRIWTWVAGAGALAAVAVAIGTGVAAGNDHAQACALLAGPERDCGERTRLTDPADRPRYEELHAAVRAEELAANIAWGVAGALAVTTVVLYLLEGRAARVNAAAEGRGLALRLRF